MNQSASVSNQWTINILGQEKKIPEAYLPLTEQMETKSWSHNP